MERQYKIGRAERLYNLAMRVSVRAGLGPKHTYLITVVGRKTGRSYTTPLTVVEVDGQRWLVAPYGGVAWAENARAAGTVTLSRGGAIERVAVEPLVDARESAPVLKAYWQVEQIARRAFKVAPGASLEEFEAIASNHPVFRVRRLNAGSSG